MGIRSVNMEQDFYTYRGFPLVRNKDIIYYGNMSDPFVVQMKVLSTRNVDGQDVASKIKVYQMSTDPSLNPIQAIVKTADRETLYEALDLAYVWLDKK